MKILSILTNFFPLWILAGGTLALMRPHWFTWFSGSFITWGLAAIMLGMGLTLTLDDFKKGVQLSRAVVVGFIAQYLIMPFLGWSIAYLLKLETSLAVGLILVACCPGGTASNVITYLARANVALSVLMTTASTFAAIIMTPLLTKWLAGTLVPVNAFGMFLSTLQIVLAPLMFGLLLNRYCPRFVNVILPAAPLICVIIITLISASIIGSSADEFKRSGGTLLFAVFLLHAGGFFLGYFFARLPGCNQINCRTIAIEVGMQNGGLGAALARKHFATLPLVALPSAISGAMHSVLGSILAGIWRLRMPQDLSLDNARGTLKEIPLRKLG